ncbi:MerR family transcriptional regulator [Pseudomonas sp. JS3066]|jgi:DNA-binding transcriptional MerR regulator|uniref:MerR family transcriptional regulator n=1 Tax=unclassified Pseudomonas TaxID=196821 RepID=UPI000EA8CD79|nr:MULTISPECIES: MerR family transcriptional regulator [unclassified Pseudomonas]AYF86832.1 MerR family transcriptional regulator [Pseudomonas sp. DY-1]MDH4652242.1 MerR family transcriptional regulator [Pseudomonas sp. BN606]MRK21851.1 MerR family transcriptional regulator [Pseudomonas sp. JG-B]WVK95680.1 MerR family transcriptional regulator [Pseudomonas sp. JS3066]
MKIGDLSRHSGLAASRIRFYESKGLLTTVARKANGYREYPPEALLILEIITGAQAAGFSLDEIRGLIPVDLGDWKQGELVEALHKKIEDIEAMERRLAQSKASLQDLIRHIREKPEGVSCVDNARRFIEGWNDPQRVT